MDFCKDINVLIVAKVFGFSALSAKIIKENIENYGGKATLFDSNHNINNYSHIIVPINATSNYLIHIFSQELSSIKAKIVTEAWGCTLNLLKKLVPENDFLWKPQTLSVKTKPARNSQEKKIKVEMQPNSGKNLNFHLTKELEKLKNYYEVLGDKGRCIAYGNAIRTLRLLSFKVESIEDIKNIEGLGEKTLYKIKEILEKGTLDRLENFRKNEMLSTTQAFTEIHGIGSEMAIILYKKGVRTIQALQNYALQNPDFFTKAQHSSILLFTDFQQKIPRAEVCEIGILVIENIKKIDKNSLVEICGSYRRERELCGDVDIVVGTSKTGLLPELIESLNIITHSFALTDHKFMGVAKISNYHRRIDIYVCEPEEYWFAVLYFTGSSNYNRMLRLAASKKGLHLNNTGMFKLASGKKVLEPTCEEDIIQYLGFPVISLKERDV